MLTKLLSDIDDTLYDLAVIKGIPAWQRRAESRLKRKLAELFKNASRAVITELNRRGLPADDLARRRMIQSLIDAQEPMIQAAQEGALDAAEHGRNRIVDSLRKKGISIPQVGEMSGQISRQIRERTFVATQRTLSRLQGDVMGSLADAYDQGLGIDDARKLVSDKFDNMQDYEMERIARTEIQTTQDKVAHDTMKQHGTQFEQWNTAQDDRVRDGEHGVADHVALHGEITKIDGTFSNGLRHPGDRSGPLGEWINCRCTSSPYIMSAGYAAPPGKDRFFESEIIKTGE